MTRLTVCRKCGNEYKKMIGENLGNKTEDICPCCDKRHDMIMDHLKEMNPDHFSQIRMYRNLLENISDEEFTPEMRDQIFELVSQELIYEKEELDYISNYENNFYLQAA